MRDETFTLEPFIVPLSKVEEEIRSVIEPLLQQEGFELVDIRVSGRAGQGLVGIFLDRLDGSSLQLEMLGPINRLLSDLFDVEDAEHHWFPGQYDLEVSSPGLERPLCKKSHFEKVLGKSIRMKTTGSGGLAKTVSGILRQVDDDGVTIDIAGAEGAGLRAPFCNIQRANLIYEFPKVYKPKKNKR